MNTTQKKSFVSFTAVLLAMVTTFALSGCGNSTPEAKEKTEGYAMPDELQDCKVFDLKNNYGSWITVMRCPNSATSTTYHVGKTTATAVVTEGSSVNETPVPPSAQTNAKSTPQLDSNTVEINGEKYQKKSSPKEVKINGELYQKVE